MFPFKFIFISTQKQTKLIVLLIALVALSACTTMTTAPSDEDLPTKEESVEQSATSDTQDNETNSLLAYQGVDPMADIQVNAEIKQAYSQVAKLSQSKNYSQALTLLDSIKVKYPQLSGPDYQKARIYLNQEKLDEALDAVELSLNSNPRNYYSLNLKGIILREKGQFAESKQAYLDAIEIYPPYPNSHLNLGVLADIYLREPGLALIQYQQYQALTKGADSRVKNWIIEIKRRIEAGG